MQHHNLCTAHTSRSSLGCLRRSGRYGVHYTTRTANHVYKRMRPVTPSGGSIIRNSSANVSVALNAKPEFWHLLAYTLFPHYVAAARLAWCSIDSHDMWHSHRSQHGASVVMLQNKQGSVVRQLETNLCSAGTAAQELQETVAVVHRQQAHQQCQHSKSSSSTAN